MIRTADLTVRPRVLTAARQPRRTNRAMALMAAGLLASTCAVVLALTAGSPSKPPVATPAPASRPQSLQPSDFAMVEVTYDPGQSSGWHVHPGVHAVYVLSGTLTVYDETCVAHVYGPDDRYVGGRDPHLARNETAEPVRMVVTYVEPGSPAPADVAFTLPTPPGCPR